jgi:UDP-N-acetyl-D-mannosaminuronic acid dehydrogenase
MRSEIIVLVVGTPVDKHLNPELNAIISVVGEYINFFVDGQTIILRSTVYPGTTKWLDSYLRKQGKSVHVTYCPERVLEGKAIEELEILPQIISSFSEEGLQKSFTLFKLLTDEIIILEPMEAELTKLFNNVWRYIKFAAANQFFMIANDLGLDFYKIYHAMTYKYSRATDFPTPGFAAGPCLFKDAIQLGSYNQNFTFLGHAAMFINEGLPNYILRKLQEKYDLSELTIGILGMSFKSDHDDSRESLSYKIKKVLEFHAKMVLCSDPYIIDEHLVSIEKVMTECQVIIIASPHSVYKTLNFDGQKVVDLWNLLGNGALI